MTLRPGWGTQRDLASKENELENMVQYYEDLRLLQRTGVWILACRLGSLTMAPTSKVSSGTHTYLKTNKAGLEWKNNYKKKIQQCRQQLSPEPGMVAQHW